METFHCWAKHSAKISLFVMLAQWSVKRLVIYIICAKLSFSLAFSKVVA